MNGSVAYILMGFPRVSETFIASEIHRVEQAGVPLKLFVIKPVEEREQGTDHPVLDAINATPEYLPDPKGLTKPMHLLALARPRARSRRRCGAASASDPHGVARATRTAFAQAFRDRRTPLQRPAQDLHQGADPGDHARRPAQPPPRGPPPARALRARHDDDHLARRLHHRPAVQLHRPRPRHLRARAEPEGLAQAQAQRRALRRHLHRGERRAPQADRPQGEDPPRLPRPLRGLHGPARSNEHARPRRNGHLRILGVGRLVAKKGFETLIEACAVLQERGVPFEARIVGQDDKHGDAIRRRIKELNVPVELPGPVGPAKLLDEYRRAGALCMPSKLLANDRDGIPNVLVEAMAAGAPVVATNVSGIPELVEHEVNGLLIEPEDPRGARRRADPPARGPRAGATAHRRTPGTTVSDRFDGERLAQDLAALFTEATR